MLAVRDPYGNIVGYSETPGGSLIPQSAGGDPAPSQRFLELQNQYEQQHYANVSSSGTILNKAGPVGSNIPAPYQYNASPDRATNNAYDIATQTNALYGTVNNPAQGQNPYLFNKALASIGSKQIPLTGLTDVELGRVTVPPLGAPVTNSANANAAFNPTLFRDTYVTPNVPTATGKNLNILLNPGSNKDVFTDIYNNAQSQSQPPTVQQPQNKIPKPLSGPLNQDWSSRLQPLKKSPDLNTMFFPNQSNKNYGQADLSGVSNNINKLSGGLSGWWSSINQQNPGLSNPYPIKPITSGIFNNTLTNQFSSKASKQNPDTMFLSNQSNKNYGQVDLSGVSNNINKLFGGLSGGGSSINQQNPGLYNPYPIKPITSGIFNNTLTNQFSSKASKQNPDTMFLSNQSNKNYGQVDYSGLNPALQSGLNDLTKSTTDLWAEISKKRSSAKDNSTGGSSKDNIYLPEPLGSFGSKHEMHPHTHKMKKKKVTHISHATTPITESAIMKEMGLLPLSKTGHKKPVKPTKSKKVVKKKPKQNPMFWGI